MVECIFNLYVCINCLDLSCLLVTLVTVVPITMQDTSLSRACCSCHVTYNSTWLTFISLPEQCPVQMDRLIPYPHDFCLVINSSDLHQSLNLTSVSSHCEYASICYSINLSDKSVKILTVTGDTISDCFVIHQNGDERYFMSRKRIER